ncbi:YkgJ family cysteine cluster protein [Desulfopila sp. IMCC35006]|uniref:YkgJ family cysteine cluster protein n=1 Tax=Desulfopila sp. IMCC35006 TaxID=2569542 RepID=UPI0010ABF9DD|nr:YkgJ family cysteine cluster protein [Desulfopila sp. IMCC35006]TKB27618.1 YkgJ family cysteine cluster protein [Desulfopila sp. IMCC35006]
MTLTEQIFSCTRCGYCCHGETTVSLDASDQARMIRALDMSEKEVEQKYWRLTGKTVQMKTVDGHCIFYDDGCTVHKGRPWRCGQWPLHPSILSDENNFHTIADSCPGIKKDIGYDKFCQILKKLMDESIILC